MVHGGRKVQAGHPDGQPDPRRRELSPGRRDRPLGRPGQDQQDPSLDGRRPQRAGTSPGWPAARRAATTTSGWARPPCVPFNPNRFTFNWRYFWDYGGGILTDFCCHIVDLVHWAMDVDAPRTISAVGGRYALADNAEVPDTLEVTYEYAEGRPEVPDGLEPDRRQHATGSKTRAWASCFRGPRPRWWPITTRTGSSPRRAGRSTSPRKSLPRSVGPSSRVARRDQDREPSARAISVTATA